MQQVVHFGTIVLVSSLKPITRGTISLKEVDMGGREIKKCYVCEKPGDLRPYGPKCAMICFPCMISSPGREAEAIKQFRAQLDACGPVAVIDGTEVGPYPYRVDVDNRKGN